MTMKGGSVSYILTLLMSVAVVFFISNLGKMFSDKRVSADELYLVYKGLDHNIKSAGRRMPQAVLNSLPSNIADLPGDAYWAIFDELYYNRVGGYRSIPYKMRPAVAIIWGEKVYADEVSKDEVPERAVLMAADRCHRAFMEEYAADIKASQLSAFLNGEQMSVIGNRREWVEDK